MVKKVRVTIHEAKRTCGQYSEGRPVIGSMGRRIAIELLLLLMGITGHSQGLMLSELLYHARSGEAEYVELYNHSSNAVELSDYQIVRWLHDTLGNSYSLPTHTVAAHDYVVLTRNMQSVTSNYHVEYPGKMVECNLPPYPNDGGSVILTLSNGTLVERLDYAPAMQSSLLRNKAGVALERRSFDEPCNNKSNWFSASSVAGYGTPTYANSQSNERLIEENSFELSSTLVSPDGDGYQDDLTISYQLETNDLYAHITLYNSRGQRVIELLDNASLGTHGTLTWDGKGTEGKQLPKGRYILVFNIYNNAGTHQQFKRTVSLVD